MSEAASEPRTVTPFVVFNRPPMGMTAGQKEGVIPMTPAGEVKAYLPDKIIDFRPKVIPASLVSVETPVEAKEPAGDDEDPKGPDSSVTDSATPSEGEQSASTTPPTPTPASTESHPSPSEPQAPPATAEKDPPQTTGPSLARTIGASVQPVETTGEPPAA